MAAESRQVRRAKERRENKPTPGPVARTSMRHSGRTKGMAFSRCIMKTMAPGKPGTPATFVLHQPTRNRFHVKSATPALVDVFYPGLRTNPVLAGSLLGY